MPTPLARALVSGTVASIATTAALTLLARGAGRPAVAPINATSHWVHGDAAARDPSPDVSRTVVGYVPHHGATVFWAYLFERLAGLRGRPGAPVLFRNATAIAALAAVVDYGIVPKRLTPGWELVLPKPRVATTYAVLATGLAVGGWLSTRRRR
jgi:hypothetical protein